MYDFCSESNIHGLSYVTASKPLKVKLAWFLLVVFCFILSVVLSWRQIDEHMHGKIAANYYGHGMDSIKLPDILVCSTNRFNASTVRSMGISDDLIERIQMEMPIPPMMFTQNIPSAEQRMYIVNKTTEEYKKIMKRYGLGSFPELVTRLMSKCEDILQECWFEKRHQYDCCRNATEMFSFLGSCFRLEGVKQKQAMRGLQVGGAFIGWN